MKMVKRNRQKKIKYILTVLITILIVLALIFGVKIYLQRIDAKVDELSNSTDMEFTSLKNDLNSDGFYVAKLKDELTAYIEDNNVSSVTYNLEGENFYLEIAVNRSEEGDLSFDVEKIVSDEFDINARINIADVEKIEYRTGNPKKSTVIKFGEDYVHNYFAMSESVYYFLGQDIESISYIDDHFYYVSYNPNYLILEDAQSCSKDVKSQIDGFKTSDYYYKYGKINFLSDYYQKLSSKTYTVGQKCNELQEKNENSD